METKTLTQDFMDGDELASGPGQQLKWAREQENWSVADVAAKLRLTSAVITSLEEDNHDMKRIPLVFVRGYLRAYAKLLKLSGDDIIAQFDRFALNEGLIAPHVPHTDVVVAPQRQQLGWLNYVIFSGVLVIFITMAGTYLFSQKRDVAASFNPSNTSERAEEALAPLMTTAPDDWNKIMPSAA